MERKMKFLVVVVALAAFAGSAFAQPQEPYRLAFVTMPAYQANETNIAVYNQWMQEEADFAGIGMGSGLGDGDTSWFVLGSTAEVDARDNTGTNPLTDGVGVPVYLVDGTTLIANNNADLWDGEIAHAIDQLANGGAPAHLWAWSGTYSDGTAVTPEQSYGGPLGSPVNGEVSQGSGNNPTGGWIYLQFYLSDNPDTALPMYAISEIIPEPATMSLLAIGGLTLFRRRRNR